MVDMPYSTYSILYSISVVRQINSQISTPRHSVRGIFLSNSSNSLDTSVDTMAWENEHRVFAFQSDFFKWWLSLQRRHHVASSLGRSIPLCEDLFLFCEDTCRLKSLNVSHKWITNWRILFVMKSLQYQRQQWLVKRCSEWGFKGV